MTNTIPEVQRRIKTNARRLKLRVEHHQVFLTIPPRTSEKNIQAFLKASEFWLHTIWQQHYQQTSGQSVPVSGEQLSLPVLSKCYILIIDDHQSVKSLKIDTDADMISLNSQQASQNLKAWVREQAVEYLPQRLHELAQYYGFTYSRCQIRHAKTRWGSCSVTGAISLNAALMLLAGELVDYVILHELCHTRQLNHSARFWHEMQQVDAGYQTHRQQLKQIKLPAWWHAPA